MKTRLKVFPKIKTFEIILSNVCNLECKYCFVNQESLIMSQDDLELTLNFIKDYPNKDIEFVLHLFGGESLLHIDKIKYIIENFPFKNKIIIFTNGILLTKEFLEFTIKYPNVDFNFSLDGGEKVNNINRITHNGQGTFRDVIKNLNLYREVYKISSEKKIWAKAVLSSNNSQYLVDTFKDMKNLPVNISYTIDRENHWSNESIISFKENLNKAADYYINHFNEIPETDLFITPILIMTDKKENICGGCGSCEQLTIAPNLDLFTCARFISNDNNFSQCCIGNIKNGGIIENENLINLKFLTPNNINACKNCDILNHYKCKFNCPGAVLSTTGNLYDVIPSVCEILKIHTQISLKVYQSLKYNQKYQSYFKKGNGKNAIFNK